MSSDDGIKLIQLPDGQWFGQHYVMSDDQTTTADRIAAQKANPGRWPRYPSLEAITNAYRDSAAETEYGFDIVWNMDASDGEVPTQTEEEQPVETSFEFELKRLLNKHSKENDSGTPDFLLARFLERQLVVFNETVRQRAEWRGESVNLPALDRLHEKVKTTKMDDYVHPSGGYDSGRGHP